MANAVMKAFRVTKCGFTNNIKGNARIELTFSASYNVKYSANSNCIGELTINVTDKTNPDAFSVNVTANGIFTFNKDAAKEQLHIETYNTMFPYVRSYITTLTANAGIPPIITPFLDISKKEIYRFETGQGNRSEFPKQPEEPDDFINPLNNE